MENILHPLVSQKKKSFIEKYNKKSILGFDIPLLYETKQEQNYDFIFLVLCTKANQVKRVLQRKNQNYSIFEKINLSQMSIKEKLLKKPIIIDTNKSLAKTFIQVIINIIKKRIEYFLKKKNYG